MPEIVVSEFMDEAVLREHLGTRDLVYDPTLVDEPPRLLTMLSQARALIVRNRTQVRGDLLEAAPRLEVVGRLGVGLDNIDVNACKALGIRVLPATGANDVAVAEYVVATALLLLRGAYGATARVAAGEWPRAGLIGREVHGRVLGLVGFGAIARETASRARALGMAVIAHDPYAPGVAFTAAGVAPSALDALLTDSDAVSLHIPLTPQTRGMIGAAQLARMKRGSILINAARGGILEEGALAAALRVGHLGGAALDVFEDEPLGPERGAMFAEIPNLILTPHIAGVTEESNVRVSHATCRNVLSVLDA